MNHLYRFSAGYSLLVLLLLSWNIARGQGIGIVRSFPYTVAVNDTASTSWLPSLYDGPAGAHGFVQSDAEGNLQFGDGTPARFSGVTLQWGACLPDSLSAITTARRLRKLGVNLVRMEFFDHAWFWADVQVTILDPATGFRELQPDRMRRFDWFIYQLRVNGIYVHLPLQSARSGIATDGIGSAADSTYYLDPMLNYLYPQQVGMVHRSIARKILEHVNPWTEVAYKDEPAIAFLETIMEGSLITRYRMGWTDYLPGGVITWRNHRRLDTLYNNFLRQRYGTQAGLAANWRTAVPQGGFPNVVKEGGFEGEFERYWQIVSNGSATVTPILTQNDSTQEGEYSMRLRVRSSQGNLYGVYMMQTLPSLSFNKLYRLTFKAKCSNPEGRSLVAASYEITDNSMSAGLSATFQIKPYWTQHEEYFIVPIRSSAPLALAMWYGEKDGDLMIDDIQIHEYDAPGVTPGESIDDYSVARIPVTAVTNVLVSPKRVIDQSDFYMTLEGNYLDSFREFLHDSVGARQLVAGAGHFWASGSMETSLAANDDISVSSQQWDYASGANGARAWMIRNYSMLRIGYAGIIYSFTAAAHRRQPYIVEYSTPYPNRYQAETMGALPLYALLQGWDATIWDNYAADAAQNPERLWMDSLSYMPVRINPTVTSLLPATSYLFRAGLLKTAETTIAIQRGHDQIRTLPRLESLWGGYGVPGGIPGITGTLNRVVNDSVNAEYFTQANDIAYPAISDGEVHSDTRELVWEFTRGSILIDAPRLQGAIGSLVRAGGIQLSDIDITLLSPTETATLLWMSTDTTRDLAQAGRSFLAIATRSENNGMVWMDSTYASTWGNGPMMIDAATFRLDFHPDDSVNVAIVTPLDSTGTPFGEPIRAVRSGEAISVTIDQSRTHALWYAVDLVRDAAASVEEQPHIGAIRVRPTLVDGHCYVSVGKNIVEGRVEIFDALGRRRALLHNGRFSDADRTFRVDASDLEPGAYLLRLVSPDGTLYSTMITVVR